MTRVVFLCGHNAARSQMAEGFLRALGGGRFVAESAGTVATELHPLAVRAMREVGIDISSQRSKSVDELHGSFDVCVTVCDANCPIPPNAGLQLRWKFADPALARGTEAERLAAFRLVRDGIEKRVRALIARYARAPTQQPAAGNGTAALARPLPDRDRSVGTETHPKEAFAMQDKQGQTGSQGEVGKQGQQQDQAGTGGQGQYGKPGQGGQGGAGQQDQNKGTER